MHELSAQTLSWFLVALTCVFVREILNIHPVVLGVMSFRRSFLPVVFCCGCLYRVSLLLFLLAVISFAIWLLPWLHVRLGDIGVDFDCLNLDHCWDLV